MGTRPRPRQAAAAAAGWDGAWEARTGPRTTSFVMGTAVINTHHAYLGKSDETAGRQQMKPAAVLVAGASDGAARATALHVPALAAGVCASTPSIRRRP